VSKESFCIPRLGLTGQGGQVIERFHKPCLHERGETLRSIIPGDIQAAAQKLTGSGRHAQADAKADARAFVFVMNPE
jgi:hypothetical protein